MGGGLTVAQCQAACEGSCPAMFVSATSAGAPGTVLCYTCSPDAVFPGYTNNTDYDLYVKAPTGAVQVRARGCRS